MAIHLTTLSARYPTVNSPPRKENYSRRMSVSSAMKRTLESEES
ncbi:hypothetical protein GBAR_LOCUS15623 [Geodia barretti]|uniref:Uncharacterized protein n=1 Tax=Geodia barretti TaxID=519541 RepID=A0AA35WUR4_GEOBA|nr:hypothetical protein GBAR_LOCUS15623 [Geodia barretti]